MTEEEKIRYKAFIEKQIAQSLLIKFRIMEEIQEQLLREIDMSE